LRSIHIDSGIHRTRSHIISENHQRSNGRARRASTGRTRRPQPREGQSASARAEPVNTWRRVDLHLHTPASSDYQQPDVSPLTILRQAAERGLDIIALTDHNSVRGYASLWREIEDLELLEYLERLTDQERDRLQEYRRLLGKMLVLPGFEFTATFGFHILAIFPEGTTVRMMEHLLLTLGVPEDRFGSGEVGATSDVLRAYELLDRHGAIVIGAHVNSAHGIAMQSLPFGGQTKIAYTQDRHLHALEVTDLHVPRHRRSTARFFNGSKAEYPRQMHCIQGSDAHRLERDPKRESNLGIGDRATEMLLPEISFQALKDLLAGDDFTRTRPYVPIVEPADEITSGRIEGNTATQVFHERLATKRDGSKHILRDIVAFANSEGGTIYVGLSPNTRRAIPGVPDADQAAIDLSDEIAREITPTIDVPIDIVPLDDRSLLALRVQVGLNRPHALAPGSIYVRDDAESRLATRDELVEMIQAAGPDAPRRQADHVSKDRGQQNRQRRRDRDRSGSDNGHGNGKGNGDSSPQSAAGSKHQNGRGSADAAVASRKTEKAAPSTTAPASEPEPLSPASSQISHWAEDDERDGVAPASGVEIISSSAIDGVIVYTLRDLRNSKVIHNVRRDTTRRIWRYAIEQHETTPLNENGIRWQGDRGFWKTYTPRGGDRRFNLVARAPDGIRIFYAVGEDALDDEWQAVLPERHAKAAAAPAS
jgi:hypothetical protein